MWVCKYLIASLWCMLPKYFCTVYHVLKKYKYIGAPQFWWIPWFIIFLPFFLNEPISPGGKTIVREWFTLKVILISLCRRPKNSPALSEAASICDFSFGVFLCDGLSLGLRIRHAVSMWLEQTYHNGTKREQNIWRLIRHLYLIIIPLGRRLRKRRF